MNLKFLGFAAVFCASSFLFAQDKPLHGIDVADLNRNAKPCQDFYEFANGNWRAHNPIPPSMTIWSKRSAAGEATKDVLKTIPDEAAANSATAAPKIHRKIDWRLLRRLHGREASRFAGEIFKLAARASSTNSTGTRWMAVSMKTANWFWEKASAISAA